MEKPGPPRPGPHVLPTTVKGRQTVLHSEETPQLGDLSSLHGHFESEMIMEKTTKSNVYLSFDDAVDIWLRHWAGEFQHTTAAAYGVNQGRINEILKGRRQPGSEAVASAKRRAA